jgi:Homeodomain-like domain
MQQEATRLAGDAAADDPAVGLAAVTALRSLLESLERLQVARAREQGWQWQRIAAALGVSKQAVHKKYGDGRRMTRRRP